VKDITTFGSTIQLEYFQKHCNCRRRQRSQFSASVCWETFTHPRLFMGLGSVKGRKFILFHYYYYYYYYYYCCCCCCCCCCCYYYCMLQLYLLPLLQKNRMIGIVVPRQISCSVKHMLYLYATLYSASLLWFSIH